MSKSRAQVPESQRWGVETFFKNISSWNDDLKKWISSESEPFFPELQNLEKNFISDPKIVLKTLEETSKLFRKMDRFATYAHLRLDEETTNNEHNEAFKKIISLVSCLQKESAWVEPKLLSLPENSLKECIDDPSFKEYSFYLKDLLRKKAHTRSHEVEELLAESSQIQQTSARTYQTLTNADFSFPNVKDSNDESKPLSHALYGSYQQGFDRTLRKNSFEAYYGVYNNAIYGISEMLAGQIQAHIFSAHARKHKSSLDHALFTHNIPISVYDLLIKTTKEHTNSFKNYLKVKKKHLQLDVLKPYDLMVPLTTEGGKKTPYDQAVELTIASTAPLGSEYQETLRQGLTTKKWIDPFENSHKRSGAYSSGCYDSEPFILMNYNERRRDLFTLAHEAGHSMHSYLSHKNQPYSTHSYSIFLAEIASTVNEELLFHYLISKTDDPNEKLSLINYRLDGLTATFFRQVQFAEFEQQIHKYAESHTPMTKEFFSFIYQNIQKDFFGDEVAFNELSAIEWARIPHFYYNFYVYQYATGIAIAQAFAEKILSGEEQGIDNYLNLLKAGGSAYPLDLLKQSNIDLTRPDLYQSFFKNYDQLVKEISTL